ncbi:MAG: phospho-N-acetylmuramoyl-pentapeptide-transferase [Simkaniaceae bacterium]|nr:phospho-N-acetylmuramoyl-pentapeptide-transferase [Simkaniaceae bacterium]
MFLFLLDWLHHFIGIKIPTAFAYSSTRMILASITSLLLTIFFGPWFIKMLYQLKIGQPIRKKECPMLAELHKKKEDTPTMGGILIVSSITVSALLWMDLRQSYTYILLFTILAFGGLGATDDWFKLKYKNAKGISGRSKLFFQLLFSTVICGFFLWIGSFDHAGDYFLPFMKTPFFILSGALTSLAFLFGIFIITGASNAVNLTDGLDGLAAGCIIPVALVLALIAFLSNHIDISRYLNILYLERSSEIAIFLSAVASSCLGFLWFNGYPAQVFMGDTGSLSLGAVLGVSSVLLRREFLLAIIGGIFVAEALSVILQVGSYKLRHKKRVFLCAPLHHHFEYKGWPETKVVLRFWIVGILLAAIGLSSIKFQ